MRRRSKPFGKRPRLVPRTGPLRVDAFGSLIWKEAYGNTNSKLGWEIDHIRPVASGGGDEIENLQPLQWENNRKRYRGCGLCGAARAGRLGG